MDGALPLHELEDLAWKDEDVTTVGSHVVRRLGRLPSQGERFRLDGYAITVEQADGRRVQRLRFRRARQAQGAPMDGTTPG